MLDHGGGIWPARPRGPLHRQPACGLRACGGGTQLYAGLAAVRKPAGDREPDIPPRYGEGTPFRYCIIRCMVPDDATCSPVLNSGEPCCSPVSSTWQVRKAGERLAAEAEGTALADCTAGAQGVRTPGRRPAGNADSPETSRLTGMPCAKRHLPRWIML